jgi:predicted nuclease with TOPRIM domain
MVELICILSLTSLAGALFSLRFRGKLQLAQSENDYLHTENRQLLLEAESAQIEISKLEGESDKLEGELKKLKDNPRPDSVEVQEFLLDLMNQGGILQVKRIDPANILLRSRGRQ